MSFKQLSPTFFVSTQITEDDVARASEQGIRTIIDNRPDGEEAGQPTAAEIAASAARHGMGFEHIPVTPGAITDSDVAKFVDALARHDGPALGYCKTGTRAATLWALSRAREIGADAVLEATAGAGYDLSKIKPRLTSAAASTGADSKIYDVVIVGGGSAGIAAASSLLKRRSNLSIAIIEPADVHYYQPGFTLVGAGVFTSEATRRPMASVMPDKVVWIKQGASGFAPDSNEVVLADGSSLRYRALVAAPGIKLNWGAIPGLVEESRQERRHFKLPPRPRALYARTRQIAQAWASAVHTAALADQMRRRAAKGDVSDL